MKRQYDNYASIACGIIRDRIIMSDKYRTAFDLVCATVYNVVAHSTYKQMKELGGFSAIIERECEALPAAYKANLGSSMFFDSIVQALKDDKQNIRIAVCGKVQEKA